MARCQDARKSDRLELAVKIFNGQETHQLIAARRLVLFGNQHAGHDHPVAIGYGNLVVFFIRIVIQSDKRGTIQAAKTLDGGFIFIERMAGDIKTEHFLFHAQQLSMAEFSESGIFRLRIDRFRHRPHLEKRQLAFHILAAAVGDLIGKRLEDSNQMRARDHKAVEG